MQTASVQLQAKALANRLVSLDPVEYNSALNQYFHPEAKLHSQTLGLSGITALKEWTQLQGALAYESHVIGEPTYNPATQTIDFAWSRTYMVPKLPSYFPFRQQLAGARKTLHYQSLLHLANVKGELLVIRADVILMDKPPLNNLIPYYFLKPVACVGAKAAAVATGFFNRHPVTDTGVLSLIGYAVNDSISGAYDVTMRTKASASKEIEYAQSQLPSTHDIEARAKANGVPVDQYKAQAKQYEAKAKNVPSKVTQTVRTTAKGVTDTALDTAFDVAGGVVVVGNDTTNVALALTNLAIDNTLKSINDVVNTTVGMAKSAQRSVYYAVGTVLNTAEGLVGFAVVKKKQAQEQGKQLRKRVADNGVPVTADEIERYLVAEKDEVVQRASVIAQNAQELTDGALNYAGTKKDEALKYASAKEQQALHYAGQVANEATDVARNVAGTAIDAGQRAQKNAHQLAAQTADTAADMQKYASDKAGEAQRMAKDKAGEAQQYASEEARKAQGIARKDGSKVGPDGQVTVDALLIPVEPTNDNTAELGAPVPVTVESVGVKKSKARV